MATRNIMIVGVGGQGTLLTSRVLGGLALEAGFDVKLSEVHGMAQRGGSVVTYVRYGEKVAEPIVEEGCADVIIAFERLEALRYAHFLKKGGVLIVNDQRIDPMPVVIGAAQYPENILEMIVKDRGRGISDIEKARQPMFTTGGEDRSGMGFTIMESFMDKLSVRSVPGRGTTVVMKKKLAPRLNGKR